MTTVTTIERAQLLLDDIGFRLGDLTNLIGELAQGKATSNFADACPQLYTDLVGHANLTVRTPLLDLSLPSIVPPGRRFQVSYATPTGRERCWYRPDAGGIFTDGVFSRIDPPQAVRDYILAKAAPAPAQAG
jgi:hypothetical protein